MNEYRFAIIEQGLYGQPAQDPREVGGHYVRARTEAEARAIFATSDVSFAVNHVTHRVVCEHWKNLPY